MKVFFVMCKNGQVIMQGSSGNQHIRYARPMAEGLRLWLVFFTNEKIYPENFVREEHRQRSGIGGFLIFLTMRGKIIVKLLFIVSVSSASMDTTAQSSIGLSVNYGDRLTFTPKLS